jgi:hypothetical protein
MTRIWRAEIATRYITQETRRSKWAHRRREDKGGPDDPEYGVNALNVSIYMIS